MIPPRDVFILRWRRKAQQLTKNRKTPKGLKKQQIIIMLKIKKPSLAAASEQAKAPQQIH